MLTCHKLLVLAPCVVVLGPQEYSVNCENYTTWVQVTQRHGEDAAASLDAPEHQAGTPSSTDPHLWRTHTALL